MRLNSKPRTTLVLVGLVAAGTLAVAACSSGGEPSPAASVTPEATNPAAASPAATTAPSPEATDAADQATVVETSPAAATAATAAIATAAGPCDLLSDEVAAAVLGVEIARREGNADATGQNRSCIKGTERGTAPASDLSGVSYVSVGVLSGTTVLVDQAGAQADAQQVDGIGDRAVYVPSAGVLFVAVGTDTVQVQVVKGGVPGSQQDAVTAAADVLTHTS